MISFQHGCSRNTKCYVIRIVDACFYVSYNTIIGASLYDGENRRHVRLDNTWGKTTGRHMNDMDIRSHEIVSSEELHHLMKQHLIRTGQQLLQDKLKGTHA